MLQRIFSFRERNTVRVAAVGALAWIARCPHSKRWMECYDENNLKGYRQVVKSAMSACGIDVWVVPSISDPEYERETGIVLDEGV